MTQAHDLVIERYHGIFLNLKARLEHERDRVDCTLHVIRNRVAVKLRLRHGHPTSVTQPVLRPSGPPAQRVTPPTAEQPFTGLLARGHSLDSPPGVKAECESGWHTDGDVSDFGNEFDNDPIYDTSDDLLGQRSPDGDSDCSQSE